MRIFLCALKHKTHEYEKDDVDACGTVVDDSGHGTETVTTMMTQKLGLNADQQKKVEALNKKYESVLRPGRGGSRPQMNQSAGQNKESGQRPELTDEQKAQLKQRFEQRKAYEKELKGILSEDQYKTYQQMRPQHGMRGRHHGDNSAQQQRAGNQQHCDAASQTLKLRVRLQRRQTNNFLKRDF